MTPFRTTRSLLLAVTALTALAGPALPESLVNGGGVNIPGVTLPEIRRNAAPRVGITTSVGQALEDPVAASPTEFSTIGDNLGNHTAIQDISLNGNDLLMEGGDIRSDGGRVLGIARTPGEETEATSKYYVDQLGLDLSTAITTVEGDVQTLFQRRINTPANQGLTGGGPLTSDLTLTVDGTVVRTSGDQSVSGLKTFTGSVSLNGGRLLGVGTPQALTDGVNKGYVDQLGETLSGEIDTLTETFLSRRVDTGTGLTGGGDLSQNRTLSFDTTWGDARYALRGRLLTAGDGLTGGGDLSANRTFALDGTVVRTSGNQIIAGNKTFTGLLAFSNGRLTSVGTPTVASDAATKGYVDGIAAQIDTDLDALFARRIDTGTGLLGGGDLTANRTLTFDTTWGDARYALSARTMTAGDGLTGGGTLAGDRSFAVDGTVVRTAGAQTIAGLKTFRQGTGTLFDRAAGQDGVLIRGRAGGVDGFSVTITPGPLTANRVLTLADGGTTLVPGTMVATTRSVLSGDGLTGGGNLGADRTLSVDGTVVRTAGDQTIGGNKTFTGLLAFSGARLTAVGTPTLASDAATKGYVDGVTAQIDTDLDALLARRIDTGTGLLGGGDLTANRTLSFDTTWGDARYALAARTLTAGDGLTGGGTLAGNRSFAVDGTVVRTARSVSAGTGLTGGGDLSQNRTLAFDAAWGDARYAEHVTAGFSNAITYDDLFGATGNGAATFGHSGAARPSDAPFTGQAGGIHIGNNWGRAQVLFPNAANRILFRNGAETAWSEVWHSGNLSPTTLAPITRSIIAGTGLAGGGDLSADRTLSFDTVWGDARYALSARSLTAGNGLTGGGNLTTDRSFGLTGQALALHNLGTNGLFARTGAETVAARAITQGSGIAVTNGDGVAGNPTVAVDASVLRTSGNQSVAGVKAFMTSPTVPTPVASAEAVNKEYVDTAVSGVSTRRVDTGTGLTGGGDLSANRTLAFDTAWGDARYAEHVTAGFSNTITYDDLFGASGNGAVTFGYANSNRPSDAPIASQAGGLHIGNTWGRAQLVFPNTGNRIFFRNGTETVWSEVWHSGNLNVTELTPITRAVNAGTGLTGGGTLSVDRTLSFDTAWGDARYALASRTLTAGDGLTGGGTLAGNRSFAVDATVVRTAGAQTVGGAKTFTASPNFSNLRLLGVATPTQGTDAANKAYVDAAVSGAAYSAGTGLALNGSTFSIADLAAGSTAVGAVRYNGTTPAAGRFYGGATSPANTTRLNYDGFLYATQLFDAGARVVNAGRSVSAGTGLTGGGALSADRTIAFDTAWGDGRYALAARTLTAGDGLTGGGTLAGDRGFAVDATVVRTAGAQTIGGAKTFTASPNFSNLRLLGVATPTVGTDAANKAYVDAAVAGAAGTTYTAGTGITLSGSEFSLTNVAAGSSTVGAVRYNGTTQSAGRLYGGTTNPTATTRLNYDGSLYATRFYASQYFYFSDETLKENVDRIDSSEGMGLIRQIRPVRYDWRESGREALGVIAQETAAILPNLVDTNEAGLMSVDYIQLIAPLIAAVQDLDARVTELEAAASGGASAP